MYFLFHILQKLCGCVLRSWCCVTTVDEEKNRAIVGYKTYLRQWGLGNDVSVPYSTKRRWVSMERRGQTSANIDAHINANIDADNDEHDRMIVDNSPERFSQGDEELSGSPTDSQQSIEQSFQSEYPVSQSMLTCQMISDDDELGQEGFGSLQFDCSQFIYGESSVTKGQVVSLLVAYYLRHRLTKTALNDLLHLLNIIVPDCVPPTKYFLERYFFSTNVVAAEQYCCLKCQSHLSDSSAPCETCDHWSDPLLLKKTGTLFWWHQ